jgi:UDP-N-acetylglucosamine 4,6-dehydratase
MQNSTTTLDALQPQTYLITGGTGSFGTAFASRLLSDSLGPRIRIFSRDEYKQDAMQSACPVGSRLMYIIGDVRDDKAITLAADKCQVIVHAAALKIVRQGERHANEFVMTNVLGTGNVCGAAIANYVPRSLLISSDKAVQSINHYGKSKATAEGVFIESNSLGVSRGCRFSIVRGGNVWASRGSVVETWKAEMERGEMIEITDPDATRFYLCMDEWTAFCQRAIDEMRGGEIFVPKLRAWRLGDLAEAFGGQVKQNGRQQGDKRHESMIAPDEIWRTIDIGWAYVIEPSLDFRQVWNYQGRDREGTRLGNGFSYSSDTAYRMSVEELRALI